VELLHSGQLARAHTHTLTRERAKILWTMIYRRIQRVSCAACSLSSWQDVIRGRASLHTHTHKWASFLRYLLGRRRLRPLYLTSRPDLAGSRILYYYMRTNTHAHIPSPKHNTLHAHKGFTPRTRVNHILCIYIYIARVCVFISFLYVIFSLAPIRFEK